MTSNCVPPLHPIPASAGMGLRFPHHRHVLETRPLAAWFEVHPENYIAGGGPLETLVALRADYPISLHAVGLSLGSASLPDRRHLDLLSRLIDQVEPGLVSDHLSWSAIDGEYLADLLPLPYSEEALVIAARNVDAAQTALGRTILIENPSRYLDFTHSTLSEAEFLTELARKTGCGLLCDLNNIYVSAHNLGLDPFTCLEAFPAAPVGEIHLAGHTAMELASGTEILIDSHGAPVAPAVWHLFERALERFGPLPTLIEWDTDLPSFEVLASEAQTAQSHINGLQHGLAHDAAA